MSPANAMRHREIVKKRYHAFFILFNPSEEFTPWDDVEDEAVKFSLELMNEGEYGTLPSTSFHFFLEKKMDLGKQEDHIQTVHMIGQPPSIQLSAHINYDTFIQADKETQFKITVNGVLFLLKYWKENLKIPKKLPLEQVIQIYGKRLEEKGILIPEEEHKNLYFKHEQTFRFHISNELRQGTGSNKPFFDIADTENMFNNALSKNDYGNTIKEFYFLYEIFDFKDSKIYEMYYDEARQAPYARGKYLYVMQQYDSNLFLFDENGNKQTTREQVRYLHRGMIEAIQRIKKMKRKPKNFNVDLFCEEIDKLLKDYADNLATDQL